jgi:ribose/xylose/arabinose/galactoside ABC-type transport system permease subunit
MVLFAVVATFLTEARRSAAGLRVGGNERAAELAGVPVRQVKRACT